MLTVLWICVGFEFWCNAWAAYCCGFLLCVCLLLVLVGCSCQVLLVILCIRLIKVDCDFSWVFVQLLYSM